MSIYERVLKGIVALFSLAVAVVVLAQVFFRFVLDSPLPWPEELGRLIFIYLVFIGGALVSLHGDHISIELVDQRVGENGVKALLITVARELLSVIVMIVIVVGGVQLAPRSHRLALSATGLPKSLMTVPVIIGAALMGVESRRRIIVRAKMKR